MDVITSHQVAGRSVSTNPIQHLSIVDRCWSADDSSAVARFLLPERMDIVSSNGFVKGEGGYIRVTIQTVDDSQFRIRRGKISWNLKQRDDCWMVEVNVLSGGDPTPIEIHVESVEETE